MKTSRRLRWAALVGASALGCGGSKATETPDAGSKTPLSIASYFAVAGEVDALQEVLHTFKSSNPNVIPDVVPVSLAATPRLNAYHGTDGANLQWDVGVQTQPFLAAMGDVVSDLGALPELTDAIATLNPLVLPVIKPAKTPFADPNTATLGVPLSMIRLNALVYDRQSIQTPPTTLAGYMALCNNYAANGGPKPFVVPLPSADPRSWLVWMLGFLPPSVIFGTDPDPAPALATVFQFTRDLIDKGCILQTADDNSNGAPWEENMLALINHQAMMAISPWWGPGFLIANGRVRGVDFDTGDPLETSSYTYTLELLTVHSTTEHPAEAAAFIKTALSPAAQVGFAKYRGCVPAVNITDPDTQITDPGVRTNYNDFVSAGTQGRLGRMHPWIADADKPATVLLQFVSAATTVAGAGGTVDLAVKGYLACAPEAAANCANNTDDDGDGVINEGCPAVATAESGLGCTDNIDNDADGVVNDGCPAGGKYPVASACP